MAAIQPIIVVSVAGADPARGVQGSGAAHTGLDQLLRPVQPKRNDARDVHAEH
jgi:hypothetical protein